MKEQKILGAILHLKPMNADATRENIKELFDNFATVKYIDFSKGEPEAYVRFGEVDKAKFALEKALEKATGGHLELKGSTIRKYHILFYILDNKNKFVLFFNFEGAKIEGRVLEGEEEEAYWKKIFQKLAESRGGRRGNQKRHNNNRRGGKGKYNEQKKNGNKRDLDNDGSGSGGDDNENGDGGKGGGEDEETRKKLKVN
jgi:hypothetical protein